mgnify:CR=1 FL=1
MCCSGGAAHRHGRAGEALPHPPSFPIRRRALLLRRRFVRRDEDEDDKKITRRRLNVTKRTEIVMEWHGSNFRKLEWHLPVFMNSNVIFLICHIYSGMDPINLKRKWCDNLCLKEFELRPMHSSGRSQLVKHSS